ncbi:Aldehyde dehydrogenase [Seminavis robusta]|uniref:Aldehyde dehydrogenase n=1 Tax=Seminavis robusta TaxID=568900 RepID=A0A9N8EVQ2_9STRA|nr:Aldehyde dehydrogenase [Seminavis robusta]|eukprot:Sro1962_g308100.1 Aldehyde dehydrogenase (621) ;mRNA; r:3849-5891
MSSGNESCPAPGPSLWDSPWMILAHVVVVSLALLYIQSTHWVYHIALWIEYVTTPVPLIQVEMTDAEAKDDGVTSEPLGADEAISILDPNKPGFIQCYDPATKQHLGEMKAMTAADVHELCVKAKLAQEKWAKTTFAERRLVLRTIQKYICHHVQDICRVASRDSGKVKVDALLGEVLTTCEKIRTINEWGELWLQPSYRPTGPMMVHKSARVEYVPFGIIAPIAPWNYPFHNAINHIISGIFAGNAVVGKVSEHTSWSSSYFDRIVKQALKEHGHDPNLVQTVTGLGEAGAALVAEPLVDKIIFTGSPAIGKKVMEGASKHLKPVILELGGKDPMVFMNDVDLKQVVPWVMRGCFQNCGQNCVGVERVFVYEGVYDEFVAQAEARVKTLRQGGPLECRGNDADVDCGAMVMDGQMDLIQALVDDAVAKGAKLHCGGKRNVSDACKGGQFYEPTMLSGVTPAMRIFQEELFGPVMTVIKVPDNDDAECLKMVNSSCFGLGSSVYGGDAERALKLGRQLKSGMCTINDFASNYLVQALPFGGCKESGFGRFAGIEGLKALCLERAIVTDRIPGVNTTIPPVIDYPIDKQKGLPFCECLIQLFYNESIVDKIKGIGGLIKYG